jgi:hypothetical protein
MEGTATASAAPTYGAAATLRYNTATARTAGAEWRTPFAATGGVIIDNTGTITLNATKVFNANVPLTINSGATLNTNSSNYALTFGGNFVNDGTFTAGSSNIVITNTTTTQSIDGFTTTGTVSMTKTGGTATFQGNVTGGNLTINGLGGILNLGSGLTHTFTGTWTRTAGTLDGSSSTLNLGGGLSGTGGTFTASTSTVNYNAAGAQTVAGVTYYNLMTSGSGTKTLGGAVIVNGALTIGPGTTLDVSASNYGITLKGDWSNSGTFTARTGTVTLSGLSAQTMSGTTTTTFYNLILDNINGLTINNNDETVSNMLTLTNGKITTGSNKVIISSTSGAVTRTNGYVIGNLQKNVAIGTNVLRTFEVGTASGYNQVNVTFASVSTAGNLTAKATSGDHTSLGSSLIDPNKSVNVNWTLTKDGTLAFDSYSATFNFTNPGDIDAYANTANFIVGKYNGTWSYPTVGTRTTTSTQATGMTSFSDFAVGEAAVAPTVTTGGATAIANISATCGGDITATGGANATSRGINYGTTTGYGSNRNETGNFGIGAFTENLTGLSPGTLYHYQAFAANSAGTGNGSDATFLTLPDAPTNFSVTAQMSTSINLSWTTGTGADTTIIRYNTSTSGCPTSPTDGISGYSGSGTSCTISSLSPGTLYCFAAWSSKTAGNYTQYSSLSAQVSQATAAAIEITAPTDISGWSLSPQGDQPKTTTGTLNVTGTGNWTVTVKDADNATGGKMTDYYDSSYGEIQLNNYLIVAAQTYNVTLPDEGIIATGSGNASVNVTFRQTVFWSDQVLPGGHSYRIIVTFTGTPEL